MALASPRLIGSNPWMHVRIPPLFRLLVVAVALASAEAQAGVDANLATRAELDAITGIGPALAGRIVQERLKGRFQGFEDLRRRVKGIGEANLARMREAGLQIGQPVDPSGVEIIVGGMGRR